MPNRKKVERSANYSYYSDLLWCTVPLMVDGVQRGAARMLQFMIATRSDL